MHLLAQWSGDPGSVSVGCQHELDNLAPKTQGDEAVLLSRDSPDRTGFPGYSSPWDTANYNPAFQGRQMRPDSLEFPAFMGQLLMKPRQQLPSLCYRQQRMYVLRMDRAGRLFQDEAKGASVE